MQVSAGVSIDLIAIIQALIIVFIAAPMLVRTLFPWAFQRRMRGARP
jgi:simple sugar transport system permease protein